MAIIKVTGEGQVTLPIDLRRKLGITKDDYLVVESEGEYLKLHKVSDTKALGPHDPMWELIGRGSKEMSLYVTITIWPTGSEKGGASLSGYERCLRNWGSKSKAASR